jgi:hypothetical protein
MPEQRFDMVVAVPDMQNQYHIILFGAMDDDIIVKSLSGAGSVLATNSVARRWDRLLRARQAVPPSGNVITGKDRIHW